MPATEWSKLILRNNLDATDSLKTAGSMNYMEPAVWLYYLILTYRYPSCIGCIPGIIT